MSLNIFSKIKRLLKGIFTVCIKQPSIKIKLFLNSISVGTKSDVDIPIENVVTPPSEQKSQEPFSQEKPQEESAQRITTIEPSLRSDVFLINKEVEIPPSVIAPVEESKIEEKKEEPEIIKKSDKEKGESEQLENEEKEIKTEQNARKKEADTLKKRDLERRLEGEKEEERHGLPPSKRGGRSRVLQKEGDMEMQREPITHSLKPEIICWYKDWEWIVGIEVSEEFESPHVTQNDELLEQDITDTMVYRLKYFKNKVKVGWVEDGQDRMINIPIKEAIEDCFVFKMRKDWKGSGRLIKRPTKGYYLVIAPTEWKRNEELSGIAPIKPENVHLPEFLTHFFVLNLNENKSIAFIDDKNKHISLESSFLHFHLTGNEISDSSDDMGPIFGEEPPLLKTHDEQEWRNVGVVVVGEEGIGRNRWRTQFVPQHNVKEQKLPRELAIRRGGWYFIRIYDINNDLLESMDFRFMSALENIKVSHYLPIPGSNGHEPVKVTFFHKPGCSIKLKKGREERIVIRREEKETIVIIPNKPAWDVTDWELCSKGAKVLVEILINRIWWSLIEDYEKHPSSKRLDKPLLLERILFRANSRKAICIWFPKPGWIKEIMAGFNLENRRKFSVKVNERFVIIPLHEFCDAPDVNDFKKDSEIKIWCSHNYVPIDGVTISKLSHSTIDYSEPSTFIAPTKIKAEPSQMRCCSTCDHARTQHENYRCRRYNWPSVTGRINKYSFEKNFSLYLCYEWRGEYYDISGKYYSL